MCRPILTYGGQGIQKRGVEADDHAMTYTSDAPPIPQEGVNLSNEPIRVIPKTPREKLIYNSLINYAKIYTVEHNVKVCFIGEIATSSMERFRADFGKTWGRKMTLAVKKEVENEIQN